jgi:hypothetical protein
VKETDRTIPKEKREKVQQVTGKGMCVGGVWSYEKRNRNTTIELLHGNTTSSSCNCIPPSLFFCIFFIFLYDFLDLSKKSLKA